jgi:hypothetical protein
MGIGEKKTPNAFVQSCEIFTYTENISNEVNQEAKSSKQEDKKVLPTNNKPEATIIDKAFDISIGEEDEVYISKVGLNIRKIDPSFDSRTYGFKNLTQLFESLPKYEVVRNEVKGLNHPLVRLK